MKPTPSRREFMTYAAGLLGLAALKLPAEAAQPATRAGRPRPKRFTIDCHQHYRDRADYFPNLVKVYREREAVACVNGWRAAEYPAILQAARAHPEQVIPFGRVDVDDAGALADVDYFAANGARGIKIRNPRYNWDDERYFPLYERIAQGEMLALFHTGIAGVGVMGMPRMRPEYLITIAYKFPELQIIGAHFGNPWYEEAAEVARWARNVHFDLTGSSLIKKQGNLKVFKEYLWWEGPTAHSDPNAVYAFEKLVFGTDEPPEQIDNMLDRYEDLCDACSVPEESRRKIFGGTMARLLGFDPASSRASTT